MQVVKVVGHSDCWPQFCIRESRQLDALVDLAKQAILECVDRLDLEFSLLGSNDNKVPSTIECVACLQLVSVKLIFYSIRNKKLLNLLTKTV